MVAERHFEGTISGGRVYLSRCFHLAEPGDRSPDTLGRRVGKRANERLERTRVVDHVRNEVVQPEARQGRVAHPQALGCIPVSYKHLTLPTNREVWIAVVA